jgi:hypothetical protein
MAVAKKHYIARVSYEFEGRQYEQTIHVAAHSESGAVGEAQREFLATHLNAVKILSTTVKQHRFF